MDVFSLHFVISLMRLFVSFCDANQFESYMKLQKNQFVRLVLCNDCVGTHAFHQEFECLPYCQFQFFPVLNEALNRALSHQVKSFCVCCCGVG